MTSHADWFREMQNLDGPGYVETRNDTAHSIVHIGKVPLSMQDGQTKYLGDVLHVPNMTKNLVSMGQMVEQGLQVRFCPHGCFVRDMKNDCCLVAKSNRNCRVFTLDLGTTKVSAAMCAHGKGVVGDIDIWHKHIGHVNIQ